MRAKIGLRLTAFLILVFLVLAAYQFAIHLNHDVAWFLYAGRRMAPGCTIYVDCFIDPNPPMALWLGMLGNAFGALTGLGDINGFRALVLVMLISVAGLTGLAPSRLLPLPRQAYWAQAAYMLAWGMLIAPFSFGQRDYLIGLLITPFLLLAVAPQRPSRGLAVILGLAAALALAMKPFALLILIAGQLTQSRDWRPYLRLEWRVLVGCGLVYLGLILWLTPAYIPAIPLMARFYRFYEIDPSALFLTNLVTFVTSPVPYLLILLPGLSTRPTGRLVRLFLGAAFGALAYEIIQKKAFYYHFLPFVLFGGLAWFWAVFDTLGLGLKRARHLVPLAIAGCLMANETILPLLQANRGTIERLARTLRPAATGPAQAPPPADPTAEACIADMAPADPQAPYDGRELSLREVTDLFRSAPNGVITPLVTSMRPFYPALNEAQAQSGMRFDVLWFVPGLIAPRPEMSPEEALAGRRFLFDGLAHDLQSSRPSMLVAAFGSVQAIDDERFSMRRFLNTDPTLAAILSRYIKRGCFSFEGDVYEVLSLPSAAAH